VHAPNVGLQLGTQALTAGGLSAAHRVSRLGKALGPLVFLPLATSPVGANDHSDQSGTLKKSPMAWICSAEPVA